MAIERPEDRFLNRIAIELGREAMRRVRLKLPSKTLSRSLQTIIEGLPGTPGRRIRIYIPHYWALYYHDGRGPVRPRLKKWLVFFMDPVDDPRTDGTRRYPVRARDIQRLTEEQFHDGLEENARRRRARKPPFMIVTQMVGPAQGIPFFTRGLRQFPPWAGRRITRDFDRWVSQELVVREKSTARARI